MTRADEDRARFEGRVLEALGSLEKKIDENKVDLNERIETLFELISGRDEKCRNTHELLNAEIRDIQISGALVKKQASASAQLWNKVIFAVIGAAFTLAIWFIQNHIVLADSTKGK